MVFIFSVTATKRNSNGSIQRLKGRAVDLESNGHTGMQGDQWRICDLHKESTIDYSEQRG